MRLRSSVPQEERIKEKEEAALQRTPLPFIQYDGKIKYVLDFYQCAEICDSLLCLINNTQGLFIIGFDLEWPFSFQTGPGKTALMQLSHRLDECFLFQLSEIKKLPAGLMHILKHARVRLIGVNIKGDIRKLSRDFRGVDAEAILPNCVDLSVLANSILPLQQRWSLEKLVAYVLKLRINKDRKVRMSRWNRMPLSDDQKLYAAIDVYASLEIYARLKEMEV